MLILDECLYALDAGILTRQEVGGAREARAAGCHLVLSGRNAPDWLVREADLVTRWARSNIPGGRASKAAPGI